MTPDQLKSVEEKAGYFFSPEEIAIINEYPDSFIDREDFQRAYKKGRLIKEAALRKSIIDLATSGSSPAQVLAVQIMKDTNLDRIKT